LVPWKKIRMKKLNLSFRNDLKPRKGTLLVSDPLLDDQFFGRSVVLLCEHNQEGTFGFVLNNYVEIDLHRLDPQFPDISARISFGGPIARENLFFIHRFDNGEIPGAVKVADGIYYGGEFEPLTALLLQFPEKRKMVRFFIGYSGWSTGQLAEEMEENAWISVNNISTDMIFDTENNQLWKDCLEQQGEPFKLFTFFPRNPQDN